MLVDSVTLQHFGCIDRLSLLTAFSADTDPPHWTPAVRSEVLAGMATPACQRVLACPDLGTPTQIATRDLPEVMRAQISLGGGGPTGLDHLGEAETLVVADRRNCAVITDDNAAHQMLTLRLGPERVHDTVDVLRWSVGNRIISARQARLEAEAICAHGRHLRRVHPADLRDDYFLPVT